ncbi:hypothetical protein COCON_G00154760 [Conger conger]|uniref:Uncharacterized protein n=1 Tax=Conger conger TaxID=82655 RepID=A0A9Q1HU76_CONCO|nr:hypothetical protein COCON_G00154760 [Conger conger]
MEFTSDEMLWLEKISSEVCEDCELSPLERILRDMAKPKNELEEKLFELTASVRFGLAEPSSFPQIYPQQCSNSIASLSRCG